MNLVCKLQYVFKAQSKLSFQARASLSRTFIDIFKSVRVKGEDGEKEGDHVHDADICFGWVVEEEQKQEKSLLWMIVVEQQRRGG